MSITFTNLEQVQKQLHAMPDKALKALAAGVYKEGEEIMTKSKRVVPVDLGTLRASGFVDTPVVRSGVVTVTLGYGGAAKAYALIQHEAMDYNHPGQGGPKYLERPVNEAESGFGKRVAKEMERRLV